MFFFLGAKEQKNYTFNNQGRIKLFTNLQEKNPNLQLTSINNHPIRLSIFFISSQLSSIESNPNGKTLISIYRRITLFSYCWFLWINLGIVSYCFSVINCIVFVTTPTQKFMSNISQFCSLILKYFSKYYNILGIGIKELLFKILYSELKLEMKRVSVDSHKQLVYNRRFMTKLTSFTVSASSIIVNSPVKCKHT